MADELGLETLPVLEFPVGYDRDWELTTARLLALPESVVSSSVRAAIGWTLVRLALRSRPGWVDDPAAAQPDDFEPAWGAAARRSRLETGELVGEILEQQRFPERCAIDRVPAQNGANPLSLSLSLSLSLCRSG